MRLPVNTSYPPNCDIGNNIAGEWYLCNQILYQNHSVGRSYIDSSIFILSNSFSDTPSGSSFSDYLSMKTGSKNFTYVVTGQAVVSTAFNRIFNNPEYFLKNKKVLVLHLGITHLLSASIPNFQEEAIKRIECNHKLLKSFAIKGNESIIPEFALQMSNPSVFKIDNTDQITVIDTTLSDLNINLDKSKELFIVVDYTCLTTDQLFISINSVKKQLSGTYRSFGSYGSSPKIFFTIPGNTSHILVNVHGKPGAIIAIQSIQLFQ